MSQIIVKDTIIKIGNWIFSYRNFLFPFLYLFLFIPSENVFETNWLATFTGLLLIISGVGIRISTIGLEYIVRGGLKRKIYAEELVTGGIYKICRNPMYLGNLLILAGFGIFANSLLFIAVIFPAYIFIYWMVVQAEEIYLQNKFGKKYESYKKQVPSIILSFKNINGIFEKHKFNWNKVLFKEYNSLFLYIFGLLIISVFQKGINPLFFSISLFVVSAVYLAVKAIKYKRRILNNS